jgi:plastocyanin
MRRNVSPILRLSALGLLAFFALVACGQAATTATTAPSAPPAAAGAKTATVTYKSFAVSPATLTVSPGTTVTWKNDDGTTHTVTSGKPGTKTDLLDKQIAGGASTTFTFDKAGAFDFFCSFHNSMVTHVEVK